MHRLLAPAFTTALATATLATSTFGLIGCTQDEHLGHAAVLLTARSAAGNSYRLRHADLAITGPESLVLRTEDDPSQNELDFHVQAGAYSLTVAPGWNLERLQPDGSAQAVAATMVSPAPLLFEIRDDETTAIQLSFRVGGDVIDFGHGDGRISIDVDDSPAQPQQIVIGTDLLALQEGTMQTVDVALAQAPAPTTVVHVFSSSPDLIVTPTTLTFTATNYRVPQTVWIAAPVDDDAADATAVVTFTTADAAAHHVAVRVIDADIQGPVLVQSSMSIAEGQSASNGVRLRARPTAPVTVDLTSDGQVTVTPAALTFTPDNYDVVQSFSIATVHDADWQTNAAHVIVTADGVSNDLLIEIVDVDAPVEQRIIIGGTTTTVTEGTSITGTLRLAADPRGTVVVHVTTGSPWLVASDAALTFDSSNWQTPRAVSLTALEDDNTTDENVAVEASVPGIASTVIAINVLDNDR